MHLHSTTIPQPRSSHSQTNPNHYSTILRVESKNDSDITIHIRDSPNPTQPCINKKRRGKSAPPLCGSPTARGICGRFFLCKAEARPRRGVFRLLAIAAPPDGSRGSRSAPGSRRLSHIRQSSVFSLPCLDVYHWLRTRATLTPATFRLPHPRPSARRGDCLAAKDACRRNTPSAPARQIRRDFVRAIISFRRA